MRRKKYRLQLIQVALLIGTLGIPTQGLPFTLVHSNDVQGDLEPCGCRNNPQGGVVRKANLVSRIKDPWVIQLDAGDLLFSTLNTPELLKNQSEFQAGYLLKALDLMKHQVAVPGEKDYSLGVEVFETLRKKTRVEFIAANLKLKKGRSYLKSSLIFSDGVSRVGVFGIVGQELPWPKELQVSSPVEAARVQVEELKKKKVDFIIALTHQGFDADVKLAKKVSGIDLVIGGHSQSFLQEPVKVGRTQIVQASFKNQYLGVAPLERGKKGTFLRFQPEKYELVGLDGGYDSPQELPSQMDDLVKEFKVSLAQLNSRKDSSERISPPGSQSYQTFPQCAQCHLKQFEFWRQTPHFQAFTALKEKSQEQNKECLQCHSLGLGQVKAFTDLNVMAKSVEKGLSSDELHTWLKTLKKAKVSREVMEGVNQAWPTVQCEHCHSQRESHPFSGGGGQRVEVKTCLQCHTLERAPLWYRDGKPRLDLIQEKKDRMSCPAGHWQESDS